MKIVLIIFGVYMLLSVLLFIHEIITAPIQEETL